MYAAGNFHKVTHLCVFLSQKCDHPFREWLFFEASKTMFHIQNEDQKHDFYRFLSTSKFENQAFTLQETLTKSRICMCFSIKNVTILFENRCFLKHQKQCFSPRMKIKSMDFIDFGALQNLKIRHVRCRKLSQSHTFVWYFE